MSNFKKIAFVLLVSLLLSSLLSIMTLAWTPLQSEWDISTVDCFGFDPTLKLDSNGNANIAYKEIHNSDLKYAFWNGSSWVASIVDSTEYSGYSPNLEIDSKNKPHVSYGVQGELRYGNSKYTTNEITKYAFKEASEWNIENIGDCIVSSLKLDSNERPHIAYSNGQLQYLFWDGSLWRLETLNSSCHIGEYLSLALDSNDNPHVSYYEYTDTATRRGGVLKYAWFTGKTWEVMDVDSAVDGSNINLVLDHNNQPHILYSDKYGPYRLRYAVLDNSSWKITIVDPSAMLGTFSSISLDSKDQPHIIYCDIANGTSRDEINTNYDPSQGILKYAWVSDNEWQTTRIANCFGDVSLVLDGNDHPHVSYTDPETHDVKYAVLSSALTMPSTEVSSRPDNSIIILIIGLISTLLILIILVRKVNFRAKSTERAKIPKVGVFC
jgi:hypothetical protein